MDGGAKTMERPKFKGPLRPWLGVLQCQPNRTVFVTTDLFISIFIIVIRRGFFYLHKVNSEGKSE